MNRTITVVSYNICHGHFADFDWERIASPIRALDPDLVGIQEVDMFTRRSRGINTLQALAEATGLPHAFFVPTMDYDAGQYGTAILSRYPIEESVHVALPAEGLEPRAVGYIRVCPDGKNSLWFGNTHLSYKSAEVRHAQLSALHGMLCEIIPAGTPAILTGDFNTEERLSPVVDCAYSDINEDHRYLTFRDPAKAIDRILYTHASLSPVSHGMVESDASDHNLLWSRFSLI